MSKPRATPRRDAIYDLIKTMGPLTGPELVRESGSHPRVVQRVIRTLREQGRVVIQAWEHIPGSGNAPIASYGVRRHKNQVDAPRVRQSYSETSARYRRRHAAAVSLKQSLRRYPDAPRHNNPFAALVLHANTLTKENDM